MAFDHIFTWPSIKPFLRKILSQVNFKNICILLFSHLTTLKTNSIIFALGNFLYLTSYSLGHSLHLVIYSLCLFQDKFYHNCTWLIITWSAFSYGQCFYLAEIWCLNSQLAARSVLGRCFFWHRFSLTLAIQNFSTKNLYYL